jgi:putative chitinase
MILKRGDINDNVKKLQEKLGVDPIGKFGPKTEDAVKSYQSSKGLPVTGIVDAQMWAMINGAAPAPKPIQPLQGGLNLSMLKGHIPDNVISQIPIIETKFEINTPLRLAHFLSQAAHESGKFKLVTENLNYSAKGLRGIFGKYFPTDALANQYQRQPEKIANKVYANRMSNGSEASGDGYRFRGRGYIQLTGRANYSSFTQSIGEDCVTNPDLVATKYPLVSAAWFFHKNGIHKIADEGASDAVVTKITKRVNGGTIGLADRIKEFKHFYSVLS